MEAGLIHPGASAEIPPGGTGTVAARRSEDSKPAGRPPQRAETLDRGLRILSLFSENTPRLRLHEIAEQACLPLPTASRLVSTLERSGYLERLPDSRLQPAPAVLVLGFAALAAQDLVQASASPLRWLADVTGQTVNLGVLHGDRVLYLARLRNSDLVTANVQVGSLLPAAYTSMGKMLLASLEDGDLSRRVTAAWFPPVRGPKAVSDTVELRAQLAQVRQRGWALQDEEVAAGLRSVAGPVHDSRGVVAAFNIAVNAGDWEVRRILTELLEPLLEACGRASRSLGHHPAVSAANMPPGRDQVHVE